MKTVKRLLREKGHAIWTIAPSTPVIDALRLMAEKDIGALPVAENEKLVGIFTERDYARKIILHNRSSKNTLIRDIMTAPVITIQPPQTLRECMAIMNKHRIRHLPVIDNGQLVGMVSIGDVLHEIIAEQQEQIQRLESTVLGTDLFD
jgi:CBS domain-containing protein